MVSKGLSGIAILTIVALSLLGLVIMVTQGSAGGSLDYTRAQTVSLQAERVTNAIMVMETVPEGHVQLEMGQYQIRYDQNDRNLSLNYSGELGSNVIEPEMISYDTVNAPATFQPINGSLCIEKEQVGGNSVLTLNRTGCSK